MICIEASFGNLIFGVINRFFALGHQATAVDQTSVKNAEQFYQTRAHLEGLLEDGDHDVEVFYLLWEVCQACGDREQALEYLHAAIQRSPVRLGYPTGNRIERTILAIAVEGDFQANLPIRFLFDEKTVLHTLWLSTTHDDLEQLDGRLLTLLPQIDCVFITIAQDSRHDLALRVADQLAKRLGKPIINSGARISQLSRDSAALLLSGISNAIVPRQRSCSAEELLNEPIEEDRIIRPATSHAGSGLARVNTTSEMHDYLSEVCPSDHLFVAPFVDFRSADGFYRKYRIVFIRGVPFPVHLAIHNDWKVWYYNAGMKKDLWKRVEEERFLADLENAVGLSAMRTLQTIGRILDLDYVGLDCAVLDDGRLLVFEVETGMIVHDRDPLPDFAYKKPYMRKIFQALEQMVDHCAGQEFPFLKDQR